MTTILVSTWGDGVFAVTGTTMHHELAGRMVRSLASDDRGSAVAVVGEHEVWRRAGDGSWVEVARSEHALACCAAIGDAVFVGTTDARMLRLDVDGTHHTLHGFESVPGRASWYAGTAVVDGRVVGPPLGVRSLAVSGDGVLLANVHVGGIPRSTDGGATWHPTIDIEADVHQVAFHPTRPELAIAAAAVGLCISRDGGATWTVEARGLHAPHCSAVAFGRHDLLISAATDPFAAEGAVYRRPIDSDGPLQAVDPGRGLPAALERGVDTDGIATHGATIAVVDRAGDLYLSHDDGASFALATRIAEPSGVLLV